MTGIVRGAQRMIAAIGVASPIFWSSHASAQSAASDVPRKSGIAGVIRDSVGRPIQRANVLVDGDKLAAVSDNSDLIATPSQFLRGVRGIDLQCRNLGCVPVPRNHTSCLWLFIDGVPNGPARLIDSLGLNPNAISAIEVYDRPGVVPMEFQGALPEKQGRGFSMTGGCGAIAFWTKARVPQ
jgi:hypothetical protein